jgi:exopolysaccharide production protein ExoQ
LLIKQQTASRTPHAKYATQRPTSPFVAPLLTTCLVLQLGVARAFSFDPSQGIADGNPASHLLILATYAITLAILATNPKAMAVMRQCWPIMALPLLAITSSLWSAWPLLSFKSGISYGLTTLLGFAIAISLPPSIALGVLIRAMAYVCIVSAAAALFVPQVGVHQAHDTIQAVHAGLWRGVLGHKVALGLFSGLTLPLLLMFRRSTFSAPIWLLAVASTAACLLNAGSMTGIAVAMMLLAVLFLLRNKQLTNVVIGVVALFLILMFTEVLNIIFPFLGKSSDMTGRTDMWPLIRVATTSTVLGTLIGHGYVAGFKIVVGPMVEPFLGIMPSDSHNGFLELLVEFGYIGVGLVLAAHAWLFCKSYSLLQGANSIRHEFATVPMSLILIGTFLNYAESHLMVFGSVFTQITPILAVWCVTAGQTAPRDPSRSQNMPYNPRHIARLGQPPVRGPSQRPQAKA